MCNEPHVVKTIMLFTLRTKPAMFTLLISCHDGQCQLTPLGVTIPQPVLHVFTRSRFLSRSSKSEMVYISTFVITYQWFEHFGAVLSQILVIIFIFILLTYF